MNVHHGVKLGNIFGFDDVTGYPQNTETSREELIDRINETSVHYEEKYTIKIIFFIFAQLKKIIIIIFIDTLSSMFNFLTFHLISQEIKSP